MSNPMSIVLKERLDTAILKVILDNYDIIGYLFLDPKDTKEEQDENLKLNKTLLTKIYKMKKKTEDVTYCFVGKKKEGRMFPKVPSLATLKRVIRHTIAKDIYDDVDMVNCHPTILQLLCEKYKYECSILKEYNSNRDKILNDLQKELSISKEQSKEIILTIVNGGLPDHIQSSTYLGNFYDEMKTIRENLLSREEFKHYLTEARKKSKTNPYGSAINNIFCKIENEILQVCLEFCKINDISIGVLCFDGFMIYKKEFFNKENFLNELSKYVFQKTSYKMDFKIKPMTEGLDLSKYLKNEVDNEEEEEEDEDISKLPKIKDDIDVAKYFVELCEDNIKLCNGEIFFYDKDTGKWDYSEDIFIKYCANLRDKLVFNHPYKNKGGNSEDRVIKYGGSKKNIDKFRPFIKTYLKNEPNFIEDGLTRAKGKILFQDGVYDFINRKFYKLSDTTHNFSQYVFLHNINYNYSDFKRDETMIKKVKNILFEEPFRSRDKKTLETGKYLLQTICASVFGDYLQKKFYILIGDSNSGKGALTDALNSLLSGFSPIWSANNLLYKQSNTDNAKSLSWYALLHGCRMAISNEIKMKNDHGMSMIDANLLKSLASGGDKIQIRKNHQDEWDFRARTTLYLCCNDVPEIYPKADSGVKNRVRYIRYERVFKQREELQKLKDEDGNGILDKINETNFSIADATLKENLKTLPFIQALWFNIEDEMKNILKEDGTIYFEDPESVFEETEEFNESDITFDEIFKQKFQLSKDDKDFVLVKDFVAQFNSLGWSARKVSRHFETLYNRKSEKMTTGKQLKAFKKLKLIV